MFATLTAFWFQPVVGHAAGSQSAVATLSISPPSGAAYGQTVSLTAILNGSGSAAPTGTVTFIASPGGAIATANLAVVSGSLSRAHGTVSSLAPGSYQITASYPGDPNYAQSTSSPTTYVISQATSTTAVQSSAPTAGFGAPTTFTATVNPQFSGTPGGTVQFSSDGVNAGSPVTLNASGQAAWSTSTLAVGQHLIRASYNGSANFSPSSGSMTETIARASSSTTVSLSAPAVQHGTSLTITANINPQYSGSPTGTVAFSSGGTSLGSAGVSDGHASITTSSLPAGSDTISADYSGDGNFTSSSGTAAVTISSTPVATPTPGPRSTPGPTAAAGIPTAAPPSSSSTPAPTSTPTPVAVPSVGPVAPAPFGSQPGEIPSTVLAVVDSSRVPPIESLGAISGIQFGKALIIWPLLIPLNLLALLWVTRAVRTGRRLTSIALGGAGAM